MAVLRRSAVQAASLGRRRLLVSLEISSKDPSYLPFLQWMSTQTAKQQSLPGLAGRIRSHELAVETVQEQRSDGSKQTSISLVPGPGTHFFKFQDAWFQVKRERDGKMMDLTSGTPWETATVTTLSRDRNLFPLLLHEAQELARAAQVGKIIIYTAWGPEWRPFGQPRSRRLLNSVVLDEGVQERILKDVTDFMARGKWYAERGIPYRRGILLHGPPGSGKSSFIQALAGSLDYNICVLNLSERGLTDDKLNHLLVNAPERSFILLEDVDAAFSGRNQSDETGFSANVTFSGLLNAVDGVASSTSQRILFMTTNHIDRLDPALIRPGRVDLKELLGDATAYQARTLFSRFYAGSLPEAELRSLEDELAKKVQQSATSVSMAALQGHFIRHEARAAVDAWATLVEHAAADRRFSQPKTITPSAA